MARDKIEKYALVFIAVVLLVLVLRELQSFLRPLVVAMIVTILLVPLLRWSRKVKVPFAVTMFGLFILLMLGIGALSIIFTASGMTQAVGAIDRTSITLLIERFDSFSLVPGLHIRDMLDPAKIGSYVQDAGSSLVNVAGTIISELLIVILFTMFLIPTYRMIELRAEKHFGKKKGKNYKSVMLAIEKSVRDYLVIKSIVSLGTAVTSFIVLWIFGVDYAAVIAILTFLLNFIPNVGSFVAVIAGLLVYVFQYGVGLGLVWLAALLLVAQTIWGNYVEPKYAGNKLQLSPLIILLSLFVWYWIWGVMGMILAIPLTSIMKIVFKNVPSLQGIARIMG